MTTYAEEMCEWKRKSEVNHWRKRFEIARGDNLKFLQVLNDYYRSSVWAKKRQRALSLANNRCKLCGKRFPTSQLDVHHNNYDRAGGLEKDSDLSVYCSLHHSNADIEREEHVLLRKQEAQYNERFDQWAKKRYGDDWKIENEGCEEELEEEFQRFVYKDWCNKHNRPYNRYLQVPEEFIEMLINGDDDEYEESDVSDFGYYMRKP